MYIYIYITTKTIKWHRIKTNKKSAKISTVKSKCVFNEQTNGLGASGDPVVSSAKKTDEGKRPKENNVG